MRKQLLCLLLVSSLPAATLAAQSLVGTWVSTEPILVNLNFSLTFTDSDYQVDCTLGQTLGIYFATKEKIYFTPTKIGINSGDVGKNDVWDYVFIDNDSFYLSTGAIRVKLHRRP